MLFRIKLFNLHYSVTISSVSCQFQSCITRVIIGVIIHLVDVDIDNVDTVAIAIDVDSPGGAGIHFADGLGWRVLQRAANVVRLK